MQEVANPRFESRPAWSMNQGWADNDFLTPDPHPMKFLNIHIQSLSKNFWNFVSDIHPYSNATLVNAKQTGSGYTSTSGPSFLKTYSSIACNMTLKLYAHGMRPMRFLSECVWFRDSRPFLIRLVWSASESWRIRLSALTHFYWNADHTRCIRKGLDVTKSDACSQKTHRMHAVCIQLDPWQVCSRLNYAW